MTPEECSLWHKIALFKLDDDNSEFKFCTRLARENRWSVSYTRLVVEEYKKFLFLCCITDSGVTPSDHVDQAWHLHLTYTKSYWIDLCKNTLEKDIHHNPTKGGKNEDAKFNTWYSDTIRLYKEKFNAEPPESIWPPNDVRFSDINFRRINLKRYWLIPRPGKWKVTVFLGIFLALGSLQSKGGRTFGVILVLVVLGIVLWFIFTNKNNPNKSTNGDGGSASCGANDRGESSGCGGAGCGGD